MIKPFKKFVLVKPDEEKPDSGIILPDHENIMPDRGVVKAIGSEVQEVKKGDMIIWDRIRADNYRDKIGLIEGKYMLIKEELVLAIINGKSIHY